MSIVDAVIAGGTVGAIVAGAYLLGRHHHAHDHEQGEIGRIVTHLAERVPVGDCLFVELERVDATNVRAKAYRFTGEDE